MAAYLSRGESQKQYQSNLPNEKEAQTPDSGEESKPTINKVVAKGCDDGHYYVEDWFDNDQKRWHLQCTKCWMGKYGPKVERK